MRETETPRMRTPSASGLALSSHRISLYDPLESVNAFACVVHAPLEGLIARMRLGGWLTPPRFAL